MNEPTTIVSCRSCGTPNRVVLAKCHLAKCGSCGQSLEQAFIDRPVVVDQIHFHREVMESPLPVLVDFWAEWCGPCKQLTPILETLAEEYIGRLKIAKINTEDNRELAQRFQVRSIPTLILFVEGRQHEVIVGGMPIGQLRNWINRSLGWL